MNKKIAVAVVMGMSALFTPTLVMADVAPAASTSTPAPSAAATGSSDMQKDVWLAQLKAVLPQMICKSFMDEPVLKKRFDELKLTYDQCVSYIPASEDKCQTQLYSSIPAMVDMKSASQWGKAIGECIGKDFAEKYLVK